MRRTQIYLDEKQYRELKEIAGLEKTTMASSVREMIDVGIETKKSTVKTKPKKTFSEEIAESAKGIKFKGPKNLSKNIDKYVYGF